MCLTLQVAQRSSSAPRTAATGAGGTSGDRSGLMEHEVDELADEEEKDDLVSAQATPMWAVMQSGSPQRRLPPHQLPHVARVWRAP